MGGVGTPPACVLATVALGFSKPKGKPCLVKLQVLGGVTKADQMRSHKVEDRKMRWRLCQSRVVVVDIVVAPTLELHRACEDRPVFE